MSGQAARQKQLLVSTSNQGPPRAPLQAPRVPLATVAMPGAEPVEGVVAGAPASDSRGPAGVPVQQHCGQGQVVTHVFRSVPQQVYWAPQPE